MSKVTSPDSINRIKHTEVIAASPNSEESIRSLSMLKEKVSEILEKRMRNSLIFCLFWKA